MIEATDIRASKAPDKARAERRTWKVLVAVDGLAVPGATIGRLAPLLSGHRLVVVATWRSVKPVAGIARAAMPRAMVALGAASMDEERSRAAERVAADAAAVARECGIDAAVRTLLLTEGGGRSSPPWPSVSGSTPCYSPARAARSSAGCGTPASSR